MFESEQVQHGDAGLGAAGRRAQTDRSVRGQAGGGGALGGEYILPRNPLTSRGVVQHSHTSKEHNLLSPWHRNLLVTSTRTLFVIFRLWFHLHSKSHKRPTRRRYHTEIDLKGDDRASGVDKSRIFTRHRFH